MRVTKKNVFRQNKQQVLTVDSILKTHVELSIKKVVRYKIYELFPDGILLEVFIRNVYKYQYTINKFGCIESSNYSQINTKK